MKIIVSPTKTMRVDSSRKSTLPRFLKHTYEIREYLRGLSHAELFKIWKCNDKLIEENIKALEVVDLEHNLTPAVFAYDGLQFKNMEADTLDSEALEYLNQSLRIISAEYGVLRPMDGVIPYRLELQAKINYKNYKSMYEYWSDIIYKDLVSNDNLIINLCSKEYSDAVVKYLEPNIKMITIIFGSLKDGKVIVKSTECKMNRGRMVRYLAKNKVSTVEGIQGYGELGFKYNSELSTADTLYFLK